MNVPVWQLSTFLLLSTPDFCYPPLPSSLSAPMGNKPNFAEDRIDSISYAGMEYRSECWIHGWCVMCFITRQQQANDVQSSSSPVLPQAPLDNWEFHNNDLVYEWGLSVCKWVNITLIEVCQVWRKTVIICLAIFAVEIILCITFYNGKRTKPWEQIYKE